MIQTDAWADCSTDESGQKKKILGRLKFSQFSSKKKKEDRYIGKFNMEL